tara:strand:+ start:1631 stop:2089 length:459 start_codon:yes stop_codon:yes gene_type:complete
MLKIKYNKFYFILLSLIIFFADQLTKHILDINHKSLLNKEFIFFSIDYVKNYGAAFNIFSGSRIFLSIISLIITIILLYIIISKNNISKLDLISCSFILGGTIGNGFDRITKGYVVDFINLKFINFPVFNIADVSINIGLIITIYVLVKNKR